MYDLIIFATGKSALFLANIAEEELPTLIKIFLSRKMDVLIKPAGELQKDFNMGA